MERMVQTGVLPNISIELSQVARLFGLIGVELQLGLAPDPELRLAALGPGERKGALALARRLKLSNAQRDRLMGAYPGDVTFSADTTGLEVRQAIWRLGVTASRDQLLLAWAQDHRSATGDLWRSLWRVMDTWRPPLSPVSGDDILALGVDEGPRVGRIRKAFEDWWLAQDFPADRSVALDRLQRIAREDV